MCVLDTGWYWSKVENKFTIEKDLISKSAHEKKEQLESPQKYFFVFLVHKYPTGESELNRKPHF